MWGGILVWICDRCREAINPGLQLTDLAGESKNCAQDEAWHQSHLVTGKRLGPFTIPNAMRQDAARRWRL